MPNTIVILSDEFLNRIRIALGEIQAKFAVPVLGELELWAAKAKDEPAKLLADVDAHLAQFRASVTMAEAKVKALLEAVPEVPS